MIEIVGGTFRYPKQERTVLNEIAFRLESGDVMAILGPNGAGKTTLLRCILGFLNWEQGATLLDGKEADTIPLRSFGKKVSYVPQARQTPAAYTVEEMILLGRTGQMELFRLPDKQDMEAVDAAIEKTGISAIRKRRCSELSGGEYQMVLIARALVSEPEIMILDEPESNLDFKNQLLVLNLIAELAAEGMICIFNTHYPAHALRWGNKAFLLSPTGESLFGGVREVVTESNIARFFGVQAVIGSFETSENTYTDVIPISIGGTPPLTDPLQERVIAGVTILLENTENPEKVNELLHEYASGIIGRMGLPYREAGINLITLNLDAPIHQVLALTDRLSKLRGAHVKTTYIAKEDRHE